MKIEKEELIEILLLKRAQEITQNRQEKRIFLDFSSSWSSPQIVSPFYVKEKKFFQALTESLQVNSLYFHF